MKNTAPQHGVIGLLITLGVGMIALGGALTIAAGMMAEVSKNKNTVSGDQAFYTAESNVNEGAYQFINATLASSTYSGGSADLLNGTASGTITVIPLSWPYWKVRAAAENIQSERAVTHVITVFPEGKAFEYGVFAEEDLSLQSGSVVVNGNIFANGDIEKNKNTTINGNVETAGTIDKTDNISGTVATSTETIPPPTFDIEPYRTAAASAGRLYATSSNAESFLDGKTRNAIVAVDDPGEVKLTKSNTNLTGSLATAGDLVLTGGTFTATTSYLALFVSGDLTISGGVVINGIVYVKGSSTFGAGNNVINGALITEGTATDLGGNTTINYDPTYADVWEDLSGLNKISTTSPDVIDWSEE